MAFMEIGSEGSLNGTTYVDVVSTPGASTRRLVKNVHFFNADTVAHTVIVSKDKGGTKYELARETLQPTEYWTFDKTIICDATDEKVVAKTLAATTTTAPTFDTAYADAS
jgi:hypothetical protein